MKRKAFAVLAIAAVAALLLCGTAFAQTTINFWYAGSAGQDKYFNGAIKRYEAKNPNIKIKNTILPSPNPEIEARLNASKLSDTFPDVFAAYLIFIGTRGAQGDFASMEEYFAKWEEKGDLLGSAVDMGKFKGKLVGLGYAPAPLMQLYRKDYFAEAGLDPNKPPTTWEELHAYARKLVKRDSAGTVIRTGFDIPTMDAANTFIEPFMRGNGSPLIDEINFAPAWTDEGAIGALDFIVKMLNEKLSVAFDFEQWSEHPITKGHGSMGAVIGPGLSQAFEKNPDFKKKIGFIPPMGPKRPYTFCGYRLFTIGANSKVKDAAWEFIKFMMSKEEMWQRFKDEMIPPTRESLLERFIQDDPEYNKAIAEHVKYGKGKAITPWTGIASRYMEKAYQEALNGRKSPRQALVDADRDLRAELKRLGLMP